MGRKETNVKDISWIIVYIGSMPDFQRGMPYQI